MPILQLNNLTKEYLRGSLKFNAVDSVNFTLEKGDYINIIGRSGSGKTTLLNLISGIVKPSAGEILVENENIIDKDDIYLSVLRNEKIGYIPQGITTLANLNVIDNVVLPFFLFKREGDPYGKAVKLLEMLGIKHLKYAYPNELSGGEERRVLIARSLINSPEILMADEATAGLDIENTKEVMNLFKSINEKGISLILVSHEIDLLSYGKKTYTMKDGKLLEGNQLTK